MARWTISDGTIIESGGVVVGSSTFAKTIIGWVETIRHGLPVSVNVAAHPGGDVPLDLASDWLVDAWVRYHARRADLSVESDYQPTDDDMPVEVRERRAISSDDDPPGVVY